MAGASCGEMARHVAKSKSCGEAAAEMRGIQFSIILMRWCNFRLFSTACALHQPRHKCPLYLPPSLPSPRAFSASLSYCSARDWNSVFESVHIDSRHTRLSLSSLSSSISPRLCVWLLRISFLSLIVIFSPHNDTASESTPVMFIYIFTGSTYLSMAFIPIH